MRPGDEPLAVRAIEQVKRSFADTRSMQEFLSEDHRHLLVACDGEVPVGFALAYELPRVDANPPMLFFYEIEVRPSYHRRGIGSDLIAALRALRRERRLGKMFVLTDRRNGAARALYRSTGGIETCNDGVLFTYD